MRSKTFKNMMMLSAFIAASTVSAIASAHPSVQAFAAQSTVPKTAIASYIFVCRDAHGNLDRRACHHMGRLDPQRVTIAMR